MTVMEDPHVRTLFTQSPLPMWVCDFDSRQILDINESMLKLLNCSREDFFALSSDELAGLGCPEEMNGDGFGDDLEREGSVVRLINCSFCGGQENRFRVTSTLAVGSSSSRLVWNQAERLPNSVSERFSNWFDDPETNIFFYRHEVSNGTLIDLSESFERIFGISCEDAIGKPWASIVQWQPETMSEASEKLANMRPGMSEQMDMQFTHPDGRQRTIKVVAYMFVDQGGKVYIDGQAEDITERKEMEEALHLAREEADRANREKSDFLAQMSHELRTPLNAIMSFSQLLEVENLAPGHRSLLQDIRHSGDHLLQLINDLLDLARIESGRIDLDITPLDITQQIDDVVRMMMPVAQASDVRITEGTCRGSWILADRMRIRQVLINLLSNAIKYNRPGGSVHITVDLVDAEQMRISIEDTGWGIDETLQGRLFERFERLEATRSDVEGTGLGLVIAKQLVELMDGEIGVRSVKDKGSTFWIDVPVSKDSGATHQLEMRSENIEIQATKKNDTRVLYVEDNRINAKIVEHIFQRYFSIEIQTANSAVEGLECMRSTRMDLVLLDIDLPDMSGYEVLREIENEERLSAVPIVALTGHADWESRERGLRAGFVEYLTKPFDIERLVEVVNEILENKKNQL